MTIFGKRLSEYIAFAKLFLVLIPVVAIARLVLSSGGHPNSIGKWFSVTAVIWIGLLYYSIRVHTSGFGSYKQLLPICVLQGIAAQIVIIPAIIVAILTGNDNVFSVPEAFFGNDGKIWLHAVGHVIGGMMLGPMIGWLIGCVIMFATKKLVTNESSAARA